MTEKILGVLAHFIIAVISATGYLGIALLMAIESACIPLPSEIIMPFSGYLVYSGRFQLVWVATAGAIGCNLGSARRVLGGSAWRPPVGGALWQVCPAQPPRPDRTTHFFLKYGSITVFLARLLPVVRTFIALPAGIARMPLWRFHIYTFLGSWPWCFALAYVGMRLGQSWETDPRFKAVFHRFHLGVEVVLLAAIIWFVWSHWKHRSEATAV